MPQFNQSVFAEGLNTYYNNAWRNTGTADHGSYGGGQSRIGIFTFNQMALTGKKILSVKIAATTSASGYDANKSVMFYASNFNYINTGASGYGHMGSYLGVITNRFYNNTIYSIPADFLAPSIAAGVNTFIIYSDTDVSYGATGHSPNYFKWTSVSITVDYENTSSNCTPPTSFTLAPRVTDGKARLSWSGAKPGIADEIWGYAIQYRDSTNQVNWSAWKDIVQTQASAIDVDSPPSGYVRQFQVQTFSMKGEAFDSEWAICPYTLSRSSPPSVPAITWPPQNGITYNPSPLLLVTLGTSAGQQSLIATGYTPSTSGNQTSGKKILLKRTNPLSTPGSQTVTIQAKDVNGAESPTASRTFSYQKPTFKDTALAAGVTHIRAEHITELRGMVNTARAYYGLTAKAWAEAVTAGSTKLAGWKSHVLELRAAMEDIATFVNAWDTASAVNRIKLPTWIDIPVNRPSVEVMNQLREALTVL